jgi:hypothetical protein
MSSTIAPFPDLYAAIPTARLIEVYAAGPARLRTALEGLDEFAWTAKPRPGKWSIREIALHVTDSELVGAGRIRLTRAQPGSGFFAYDENAWAGVYDYQHADAASVERSLALFGALRSYLLPVFAGATAAAWNHPALHPERGAITLRNLLELYADHSERHIDQILENRRLLGLEIALPPLLATRLY